MREVVAGAAACGAPSPMSFVDADARRHRADDPVRDVDEARPRRRSAARAATRSTACRWRGPPGRLRDGAGAGAVRPAALPRRAAPGTVEVVAQERGRLAAAEPVGATTVFERGVVALVVASRSSSPIQLGGQQLGRQQRIGEQVAQHGGRQHEAVAQDDRVALLEPRQIAVEASPQVVRFLGPRRQVPELGGQRRGVAVRLAAHRAALRVDDHAIRSGARSGDQVVGAQPDALAQLGQLQPPHRLAELGAGARPIAGRRRRPPSPTCRPTAPPARSGWHPGGPGGRGGGRPGDRRRPRPRARRAATIREMAVRVVPSAMPNSSPERTSRRLDSRGGCDAEQRAGDHRAGRERPGRTERFHAR